ncbi:MAG: BTAD domain-containing putative transcriptional regulator, partial [Gemmatimonadaceae bacterium]
MFHLRTFGGLALDREGAPLAGAQRKALALLAILAASPKGVPRDRLLLLLWPESDTEHARGALKQTIHILRQLLGSSDALLGSAELRLNPAFITSDVGSFIDAIVEGGAASALRHYTGPFLDGVHLDSSPEFDSWAEETRSDLARRRAEAMEQLANAAAQVGDHAAAARWWQSLQATDALSGRIALKLMLAFEAAGDRAAALRHARVHAELLQQELDVAPDAEVAALAQRMVNAPSAPLTQAARTPEMAVGPATLPDRPAPTARLVRQRAPLGVIAGGGLILAVLAGVLVLRQPAAHSSATSSLDSMRVAVGIFENETGDSALAPLGKMAADWVVRGLARISTLHVLDAATLYAQPSAGSREGALDLARRNGAGRAVAGKFYREGAALVFTAAVFDVATGRVLHTLDPVRAAPNEAL